jgi:hypothetical protein
MMRIGIGEISGSYGREYEDDCLLGCCAVEAGNISETRSVSTGLHGATSQKKFFSE